MTGSFAGWFRGPGIDRLGEGAEIERDLHTLALQLDSLDQRAARDTT